VLKDKISCFQSVHCVCDRTATETMAIRREIRLRKDFLYRKQVDAQQTIRNDKKRKIKSALEEGKALPTELIFEARQLQHESELDLDQTDEPAEIDDEYANAGSREPKVCITTSRDPSSRLKQFAK
jgi:U3 small nucleolar ribonucleoprotein protein IMP4